MTLFTPIIDKQRTIGPYCGPSAIAILTGVPLSRIEKMIRRCRPGWGNGRKLMIKGTYSNEVLKVLKRLGCKTKPFHKFAQGSFAKFVDDTRHAGTLLVEVTGHWMVCDNGMIADSGFRTPVPIEQYPKGKRIVRRAWKVDAPAVPKYTIDDPITPPPRERKPRPDIKEVRANKVQAAIKRWERKKKLAETKLKALRRKSRYYQKRMGAAQHIDRCPTAAGDRNNTHRS